MKKKKRVTKKTTKEPKAMKFNSIKLGLAAGIVSAIFTSLVTIAGMFGHFQTYNSITMEVYGIFGYSLTWLGVFLGALYSFIDCFVIVWLFALIYNKLL